MYKSFLQEQQDSFSNLLVSKFQCPAGFSRFKIQNTGQQRRDTFKIVEVWFNLSRSRNKCSIGNSVHGLLAMPRNGDCHHNEAITMSVR